MNYLKQYESFFWLIGIFIFYLIMAILTPLSTTDWHAYKVNLSQYLTQENGRYLGHLFEWVAVHNIIIRALIYAITSFLVIYLVAYMVQLHTNRFYFILSFVLMVTVPNTIYSETYGWFTGFFSYIPATVLSLFILFTVVKMIESHDTVSEMQLWVFLLVSLFGQFFLENLSIANSLIILIGMVVYFFVKKRLSYFLIVGFMLSCIGNIIMFLNFNYFLIKDGLNTHYSISDSHGMIHKAGVTLFKLVPEYMFINQMIILTVISIVSIVLLKQNKSLKHMRVYIKIPLLLGLITLPIYKIFVYNQFHFELYKASFSIAVLNTTICFIYMISSFIAMASSVLPLLFVTPISYRNFYFIYTLWIVILLCLIQQCDVLFKQLEHIIKIFAIIISIIMMIGFTFIHISSVHRIDFIKEQITQHHRYQKITLERLPFERYTHMTTPKSKEQLQDFKHYYDLPKDITFKVVPYGTKQ
ncbi:MAG: hypothetical protein E6755_10895 [Staphylococcus epidermidis]|nr:hypothetical protein [Staphylococcus epidermidis]